jgi:hypothetical protein
MSKKNATITLRLTDCLKTALEREAARRDISLSTLVAVTLHDEYNLDPIFNMTDEEREFDARLYALESARKAHLKFLSTASSSILRRILDFETCDDHVKTVAARILYDRAK